MSELDRRPEPPVGRAVGGRTHRHVRVLRRDPAVRQEHHHPQPDSDDDVETGPRRPNSSPVSGRPDIPAARSSSATPDSTDTRLGTPTFRNGAPDEKTVRTIHDDLDFMRGVRAFLTGISAASRPTRGSA